VTSFACASEIEIFNFTDGAREINVRVLRECEQRTMGGGGVG
jgi:hypothetical protein